MFFAKLVLSVCDYGCKHFVLGVESRMFIHESSRNARNKSTKDAALGLAYARSGNEVRHPLISRKPKNTRSPFLSSARITIEERKLKRMKMPQKKNTALCFLP